MKIVNIKAYKYEELTEDAQNNFVAYMYDYPFDYENNEGEFEEEYFCEINDYLFDKTGKLINHLLQEQNQ
jgi:hypothetical protein